MRTSINQQSRFQIQKHLETVLAVKEDGVKYHEGWSDARVAAHFGVTPKTVANTRTRTFGKLRGRGPRLEGRLEKIEARLQVLETQNVHLHRYRYLHATSALSPVEDCNEGGGDNAAQS